MGLFWFLESREWVMPKKQVDSVPPLLPTALSEWWHIRSPQLCSPLPTSPAHGGLGSPDLLHTHTLVRRHDGIQVGIL